MDTTHDWTHSINPAPTTVVTPAHGNASEDPSGDHSPVVQGTLPTYQDMMQSYKGEAEALRDELARTHTIVGIFVEDLMEKMGAEYVVVPRMKLESWGMGKNLSIVVDQPGDTIKFRVD